MTSLRSTALVALSYLVVSGFWTWPALDFDPDTLPTRHFDLMPSIWLIYASPETFPDLVYPWSLWPDGELLARLDSYVLLLLGWINHGLLPPEVFARTLLWTGPAASALAAELCAHRGFGVPRPWSWLAGLSYGFSGIMASAALEGQVYSTFNPWLPLLLWAIWRGMNPGGRWYHGLLAGAAWGAAHLTSAYFGAIGIALLVVFAVRSLLWHQGVLRVARFAAGVAALAVPVGLYQMWLFSWGGLKLEPTMADVLRGSMALSDALIWSDPIDVANHSINAPLHWSLFWMALLAPVVLGRERGWRTLLAMTVLAFALALGPVLRLHPDGAMMNNPFRFWQAIPGATFFRFPYRFMWITSLLGGILAASVTATLATRVRPRLLWAIFPLAIIDAMFIVGLPLRMRSSVADVPDAYAAAPAGWGVLDLFSSKLSVAIVREAETVGDDFLWARSLSCYYQTEHHLPTPAQCIGTMRDDPRVLLADEVFMRLLAYADRSRPDALEGLDDWLLEHKLGTVAVHADFLRPNDRDQVLEALEVALGPPAGDSANGGERVVVFVVPEARTLPPPAVELNPL
ncbi:MAG: hypothetical protein H6739_32735 [Alphaproteobacteria bacterium]|nr:hypothetical protein [Alphaproteobacteria bacterium]